MCFMDENYLTIRSALGDTSNGEYCTALCESEIFQIARSWRALVPADPFSKPSTSYVRNATKAQVHTSEQILL